VGPTAAVAPGSPSAAAPPAATAEPLEAPGAVGETDAPPEPDEPEPPGRTERLRLAIVAFAGIDEVGYGAGVRLEIPLFSALGGVDDSFSLGLDLGVAFADVGIDDQGNGYEAFQTPAAAYLTWRFGAGDLEIGPRLGLAVVPSFGGFRGPRITGTRIGMLLRALVGVTGAVRVAEGLQLFAGLDLAIGPRVSGVISAGVAL
jgi:hypothetical protein